MNKTETKKAITKIKVFLEKSDLDHVNVGVELARSLGEPEVFERGCDDHNEQD